MAATLPSPGFSVVVPAYNREQLLHGCLQSVATQTVEDWECIVVDDGSTDGTARTVRAFAAADARFSCIRKENGGVSSARNCGILRARSEHIVLLDSDDRLLPDALETYSRAMRSHPEARITYGTLSPEGSPLSGDPETIVLQDLFYRMLGVDDLRATIPVLPTMSSCMVYQEVFRDVGLFPEAYSTGEDTEFWIRASVRYKAAVSSRSVAIRGTGRPDGANDRHMLNGTRTTICRLMFRDVVALPEVAARISKDGMEQAVAARLTRRESLYDAADSIRQGELEKGVDLLTSGIADLSPSEIARYVAQLSDQLTFPKSDPLQASRRCARWYNELARVAARRDLAVLSKELRKRASSICFSAAKDAQRDGGRRRGLQASWHALRTVPTFRSFRSFCRLNLR